MKLLITGAFNPTAEQKLNIQKLGCEIMFHKMENEPLSDEMFTADAIICNGLFLHNDLDKFPNLKFIQLTSAGLDRVPVDRIKEKGIALFNARGVYSIPMAEWALAGVLSLYKNTNTFNDNQKNHQWIKDRNIRELSGDTAMIVGCGSVGTECAIRFKAMGMKIIGVDIVNPLSNFYDEFYVIDDMDSALEIADVVILTLPLTDDTKNMFNKERLSKFKNDAILVNIARGAVINENDLISALSNDELGGAVLDVFETEPLNEDSKLWDMSNVVITPHNSFVSQKNAERLFNLVYNNLTIYMKED